MATFEELQASLGETLALNRPGGAVDHVLVALPSFSVGESLLSHYVERIPALEHRYLLAQLVLLRVESCELVFISSAAPDDEALDYYLSFAPANRRKTMQRRLHVLEVPDRSCRAVATKLLDRPDLIDKLRDWIGGRPAFIEPWNVTEAEVEVARRLEAPINGTAPRLWPLGFKSAGRRLFKQAGVPIPYGCEEVRSVSDILEAGATIQNARPAATAVVVKLDDSGAGDGNVVLDLRHPRGLQAAVESLPEWYITELQSGGVVEELVTGTSFASPSAQLDLFPDGRVEVLATHEQVLGGPAGQVYMGCRFPADPAYAARLAEHALAAGELLAQKGAVGRVALDFAAVRDARGQWDVYALEVNLRKGGTTHTYCALRNLAPGHYDSAAGLWMTDDGEERAYWSTDNLLDPAWTGLPPRTAVEELIASNLHFDCARKTGVVLHMFSGLAIEGRLGLTAIGADPSHAAELYEKATLAVGRAAAGWAREQRTRRSHPHSRQVDRE